MENKVTSIDGNLGAQSLSRRNYGLPEYFHLAKINSGFILFLTGVGALIGLIYAYIAEPAYMADASIQVQDDKPALSGLSELTDVISTESAISAEMQIVRSRSVLGVVVDQLGLSAVVVPKYFPIFGEPVVRRGLDGFGLGKFANYFPSYTWWGEHLEVGVVRLPEGFREASLFLEKLPGNKFRIVSDYAAHSLVGHVGEVVELDARVEDKVLKFKIKYFNASPGSIFEIHIISRRQAIENLADKLRVVEIGGDTGIMRLQLEGTEEGKLEIILDKIVETYLKRNVQLRSAEATQSLKFLEGQLPDVRAQLEKSEDSLARFRENNQTIDLSIETESLLEKLVSVERKISELDLKKEELLRIYTPDHPLVGTLESQRLQLIREKSNLESQSNILPDVQQELLRYVREVEVATELYTYMLNKLQELRVIEAGAVGSARLLDSPASYPDPVRPKKKIIVVGATLLSFILGYIFVLARQLLREGLVSSDRIEEQLGIPVFATIPLNEGRTARAGRQIDLLAQTDPDSVVAEALRSLRTSLHFSLTDSTQAKVVCFTGPAPNVGKTFISVNMAAMFAELGGSVLLIDCDLRRGDSAELLGIRKSPGMSELISSSDINYQSCTTGIFGSLDAIPRGKSPPNPAGLLMSERFRDLLVKFRGLYDYIVIDTPPILAVTDASLIARYSDLNVLVGRMGRSHMEEIVHCREVFEKAGVKISGVVMNGATKANSPRSKYGYGYTTYSYKTI